ncbi:MAG: SIR2 family protein [bacterium]|nr:SIR2 family protein [bacterium]
MIPDTLIPSFERSIKAGDYSLLVGTGVSLTSHDKKGNLLLGTSALHQELCRLRQVREGTTLSQIYEMLSHEEKETHVVERYRGCSPDTKLTPLTRYIWNRIFTLNIDDVLENLYNCTPTAAQTLRILNFNEPWTDPRGKDEAVIAHLHGSVLKWPETGFVFASHEYISGINEYRSCLAVLADFLASYSIIIAGTRFNEQDIGFYLSRRTPKMVRQDQGPSLYIEPDPDDFTYHICAKHGFTLVEATLETFLEWLVERVPNPPSPLSLYVPGDRPAFLTSLPEANNQREFFRRFRRIGTVARDRFADPTRFAFGGKPEWADIERQSDIQRDVAASIIAEAERLLKDEVGNRIILINDDPATGKTTLAMRIAYELAKTGNIVLELVGNDCLETASAIDGLSRVAENCVLLVDSIADHVESLSCILESGKITRKILVIGSDRTYRTNVVRETLERCSLIQFTIGELSRHERLTLVERYRQLNMLGEQANLPNDSIEHLLRGDIVLAAICRILNDFRPLEEIAASLWDHLDARYRDVYLVCALANSCTDTGLRYSILQHFLGTDVPVQDLFNETTSLRLRYYGHNSDYVVVENSFWRDILLSRVAQDHPDTMLDSFVRLANILAPFSSVEAIQRGTPEAKILRWLYDIDEYPCRILGINRMAFFDATEQSHGWNARYWEQRALLTIGNDIDRAIQFARNAVGLHSAPLSWTTLGKILIIAAERCSTPRSELFIEGFDSLNRALSRERLSYLMRYQAYSALFAHSARYLQKGGRIDANRQKRLRQHIAEADFYLRNDDELSKEIDLLEGALDHA